METNVLSCKFHTWEVKGSKEPPASPDCLSGNSADGAKCQEPGAVAEEGHRGPLRQKRQGGTGKVATGRQPGDKSADPWEEDLEPTKERKARAWMHLIFQIALKNFNFVSLQEKRQSVGSVDTNGTKHWGLPARPPTGGGQALLSWLAIRLLPPDWG